MAFERQNGWTKAFFENIDDFLVCIYIVLLYDISTLNKHFYIFIVHFVNALNFIYMYRMCP